MLTKLLASDNRRRHVSRAAPIEIDTSEPHVHGLGRTHRVDASVAARRVIDVWHCVCHNHVICHETCSTDIEQYRSLCVDSARAKCARLH